MIEHTLNNVKMTKKQLSVQLALSHEKDKRGVPVECLLDTGTTCNVILIDDLNKISKNAVNMPESINNITTNSADVILDKYSDVFHGLGTLPGYVYLQTNPEVASVQHTSRKMPVALKKEVKAKLDEMEKRGIIAPVTDPTDWISSMVVVKKGAKLHICLSLSDLYKALIIKEVSLSDAYNRRNPSMATQCQGILHLRCSRWIQPVLTKQRKQLLDYFLDTISEVLLAQDAFWNQNSK